jgi:hypothetical protein
MIVLCLITMKRRQLKRSIGSLWVLFWAASASAMLQPDITRIIARALGIGRGADLVMYCGILGTAIGFFLFYLRFRQLEGNLTKLVRHIAVQEAKGAEKTPGVEKQQKSFPDELKDNQ